MFPKVSVVAPGYRTYPVVTQAVTQFEREVIGANVLLFLVSAPLRLESAHALRAAPPRPFGCSLRESCLNVLLFLVSAPLRLESFQAAWRIGQRCPHEVPVRQTRCAPQRRAFSGCSLRESRLPTSVVEQASPPVQSIAPSPVTRQYSWQGVEKMDVGDLTQGNASNILRESWFLSSIFAPALSQAK